MALLKLIKGREMPFKAFKIKIFLKSEELKQWEQWEQLDQSNKSSSDDKYTSLNLDNNLNISSKSFSSDWDSSLFTSKKGIELKTLTPKQMLQRLLIGLAQAKAGSIS